MDNPVFVLGYARSGTTWVNTILREYLNVGLVNEGQFILDYTNYARNGNIVNIEKLVEALKADSFFSILKANYAVEIDWDGLIQRDPRSYACFVTCILAEIADKTEKQIPGSKNPGFGWDIDVLFDLFPNSQFIHVIRDGRDCALSHFQLRWGSKNAYVAATRWKKYIRKIRVEQKKRNVKYLEVFYEDLLRNPESNYVRIRKFISEEHPGALANTDASGAEFANSVGDEEYAKRTNKWKHDMSKRDRIVFEGVAADMLESLGYELNGGGKATPLVHRAYYTVSDKAYRQILLLIKRFKPIPASKLKGGS